MDVMYINPFVRSIKRVFGTMVNVKISVGKPATRHDARASADVSGIIGFSGDAVGVVALSFPKDVACKVVSRFSGTEIDENHPDFADAVGELANMIAGSAKCDFEGMDVSISLPSVVIGKNHTVSQSQVSPRIVIPCECEFGMLFVEIGMETKVAPNTNLASAGVN